MADTNNNTNNSKDAEKIKLLEEQNKIYRRQLDLQEEGYNLSTSYVESLKEVLGIRSKLVTGESTLLSLNKQINKAILDQVVGSDKISEVQKQITKNTELSNKAKVLDLNLSKIANKEQVAAAAKALNNISALHLQREELLQGLEEQNDLSYDEINLIKKCVDQIGEQISSNEENLNFINKSLTSIDKQLLYTQLQNQELDKQNNERKKELKNLEEIEQKLGLTKSALEGLNKIPILGGIIDTNAALDAARKKIKEGGDRTQAFGAAFSSVGKQLKTHLSDPLVVVGFLVTELISTFKSVDSAIGDLAKGFDLTYNGAANLRMELTDIANLSGDVAVTTKGLQESMMAVGQTLGSNARLNKEDLITFTKLREQAGYTNDELAGIQKLTLVTGGNLKDNTASFLGSVAALNGQNKLTINAKQLLKEVANVSDSIKLSIGGTTEKLAEAAFKAKQFGINLQQADQISERLLDFESSIANELSAELITGKDLNLEKARLLAINGDIAGASAEILQQVGGTAEFTKMNRIQQEAIAKATGLSRDDLAKSLMDKEALVALSGVEGKDAQEKYNTLVKQVGVEEAKKRLGNEALANQFQQQSVQERFTQTIEKLKELFVSLIEPLMPVFDVFADIMGVVGPIVGVLGTMIKYAVDFGKYLLIPYGIMKGMQVVTKGIAAVNTFLIAQNATKIAQSQTEAAIEVTKLGFGQRILVTLGLQNAARAYSLAQATTGNTLTAIMAAMQQTILGKLVMQGLALGKNLVKYVSLTLQTGYRMVAENTIVGAILAQGAGIIKNIAIGAVRLAQSIATAVANFAAVAAETFGIGVLPLLGIAAAAGAAIYGLTQMKDGEFAKPIGKGPILTGDFGSVQLDPKDKAMYGADGGIKVGTNLMGNSGGGSYQPQQDNSALIAEMRAMRQETAKSNNKPVVVENSMNGTKFGTSVAMNTYKIQ
jgi:hypothetical protein